MPQIILVIGSDWETGSASEPFEAQVMPRIGEGVAVGGMTVRVKDVLHDLVYDDQGGAVFQSKVLVAPAGPEILRG